MGIFGYDSISDMFDGGGAGGSSDKGYGKPGESFEDYKDRTGDKTAKAHDGGGSFVGNTIDDVVGAVTGGSTTSTIKSGQTLSGIAAANGLTVAQLMAANPNITKPNEIQAGASINIPSSGGSIFGGGSGVKGTAPKVGLMSLSMPRIIGSIVGGISGIDPKVDASANVGGRMVYTKKDSDYTYSYNFLGMPYSVEVIDGVAVDKLSIKTDASGLRDGQTGFDPKTAKSGYDRNIEQAEKDGDDDEVHKLRQYAEDNANTSGEVSTGRLTSTAISEMATEAGVIANQEDMEDIIADPDKFLLDRGLKLSDLIPEADAETTGTTLDANDANYGLGTDPSYTASETGDASTVADVVKAPVTSYNAATNTLTDNEMMTAATGTVSDQATVNAEDYTIDTQGAATGVNADGTVSVLGEALNDFATQDISTIIDTSTVAGKLLAQKLGEGNYTDSKATVLGQMKIISDEFKNSAGEPIIPPWAQGMARNAAKSVAFTGLSGTAEIAAMSNAIMEATLGVADKEATFFQTLTTKNLDNRQQSIINKANVLSNLEMANLDARSTAAVTNAKNFMEMDLKNLTNEQQAEMVNKQALVQALFDDTKAINASRLFTAESTNDINKFYSELQVAVERHNSSEINALSRFNTGEINDAAQFNADIKNDRQKFLSEMRYNIDLANAKWRQTVETTNTTNMVEAHTADVKAGLDLTQEALNNLWDSADNLLDYIWKTTDSDMERELRLLTAQMTAQASASGASSGSNFMTGLLTLGGAYLGSSSGSSWLTSVFKSDSRLKKNIKKIDTLKGINFYEWEWNDEAIRIGADRHPTFGVIAQEIQKTHPEAVIVGKDGYLAVNYGMINNDL